MRPTESEQTAEADSQLTDFYDHVGDVGSLPTRDHARRWTIGVLETLGLNLDRRTKRALAKALPTELATALGGVFWLVNLRNPYLSSRDFQQYAGRRSGNTDANFARIPILAVFGGVKKMIDDDLSQEVADSLPAEVGHLWQEA